MMSTVFRSATVAAALLAAAGVASASSTHAAFIDVVDSANSDGFSNLTSARITTAQLVAGLASNVNDGTSDATLQRTSGSFYPASWGLYSFTSDSTFTINVANAVADLSSVVFQSFINISQGANGVDGLLQAGYVPTLSYNGGTQALAGVLTTANLGYTDFFSGEWVDSDPNNPNYVTLAWDLSGVTTPITSFSINFGVDVHSNVLAFQVDQVAAVPEPETYALMLAGMGVVGLVARRRKIQH